MIRFVPFHQIDKNKYDDCIRGSLNPRIYALSWYLECVNVEWDLLVEGDYHVVMPLPRKIKYGIAYINSPYWVQQLGVFSTQDISAQKVYEFIRAIPKKFFWIDYQINSGLVLDSNSLISKRNYILSLKDNYDVIVQNFNQNRRRVSKNSFDKLKLDKNGDLQVFLNMLRAQKRSYDLHENAIDRLACLYESNKAQVKVWNVFKDGIMVGGLFWLLDDSRITYLVPLTGDIGKQLNVPTFIINQLIKEFEGDDLILDFEGSSVPGVEKFYKSFGAKTETYYYYRKRFIGNV